MLKKTLAMLISATVIFGVVPAMASDADENVGIYTMEEKQLEKIELTLDNAINMALEKSPRIEAADAAIKSAELSLEVAQDSQKEYKDMEKALSKIPGASTAINISSGLEQAYLKHGYYTDGAKVGLEIATVGKEQTVAKISYEVTEKYYNVKLMESLLSIAETGAELAKGNLDMLKGQFEAGYVSQLEVRNAENALVSAEYAIESYKRNLDLAKKSLKVSLQLEAFEGDIVLTEEITLPQLPEDKDAMIDGALLTRYDMTALRKDFELKSEMFDITKLYMSDKTAKYHQAYSDYLAAEYTYNNTLKMMRIGLESEYASILTAEDEIKKCESDLAVKRDIYESRKVMYDLGLVTNLELTAALADYDTSRVQLENARVTYALAVIKFGYNTTIGI